MDMPTNYKPFGIIEVKFKGSRKEFFLNSENIYLEAGELVVVEAATGGYDVGHVSVTGELVRMQMVKRRVKEEDVGKRSTAKLPLPTWINGKPPKTWSGKPCTNRAPLRFSLT
jgi:hypothetical protein